MSRLSTIKIVIYRKTLHIFFCIVLFAPYMTFLSPGLDSYGVTPVMFYSILAIIATTINAVQIKRPLIRLEIKNLLQEKRRKIIEELLKTFPTEMSIITKSLKYEEELRKLEDHFNDYIDRMERSYEKIGGYIGITHGIIGVLIASILFGNYAAYGILALMIIDPVAAIVGVAFGKHKIPKTDGSIEGSMAGYLAFFLLLLITGFDINVALLLSLVATLTELIAVEDNLFIPLLTAALAYFLQV
ncbi:MAG: hypothetical protein J7K82_05470 [Thermoproteales archaeon]|nr:hypothetical protein [Thermoproteales archaeon]